MNATLNSKKDCRCGIVFADFPRRIGDCGGSGTGGDYSGDFDACKSAGTAVDDI